MLPRTRSAGDVIREADAKKRAQVAKPPLAKAPPIATSIKPSLPERSPSVDANSAVPFLAGQLWTGRYRCGQGETALRLRISGVRDDMVQAVFEFAHPATRTTGSFTLMGRYDPARRTIVLVPSTWVHRPPGYEMVGMAGTVSSDSSTFAGSITDSNCSTFVVRR